jgi:hypothetical protein
MLILLFVISSAMSTGRDCPLWRCAVSEVVELCGVVDPDASMVYLERDECEGF